MNDIRTADDVKMLVDSFYAEVLKDALLSPFFAHLNFDEHLPKMYHFWEFVLLDKPGYTTNVFDKHAHMRLSKEHFDAWVALFQATVDRLFEGEVADQAKLRAATLGWTFAQKMKQKP